MQTMRTQNQNLKPKKSKAPEREVRHTEVLRGSTVLPGRKGRKPLKP